MLKSWKVVSLIALSTLVLGILLQVSGCGSGVDFGVQKFTLTGAGQ